MGGVLNARVSQVVAGEYSRKRDIVKEKGYRRNMLLCSKISKVANLAYLLNFLS